MSEDLRAYGLNERQADEAEALKAPVQAAGLNWSKMIGLFSKYGPVVISIVRELLNKDDATQPGATAPPTGPAVNTK